MAGVLEREIRVFETALDEMLAKHRGEFVLIHGSEIVGYFASRDGGIDEGRKRFGNVPILVREIAPASGPTVLASALMRPAPGF